jgi:hypothetical protein
MEYVLSKHAFSQETYNDVKLIMLCEIYNCNVLWNIWKQMKASEVLWHNAICNWHVTFKILYMYDFITNYAGSKQKSHKLNKSPNVHNI